MGLRPTDSDENRYPWWRTLQSAAVNFSSPFRTFAHCRLKDRQQHDESCATVSTQNVAHFRGAVCV